MTRFEQEVLIATYRHARSLPIAYSDILLDVDIRRQGEILFGNGWGGRNMKTKDGIIVSPQINMALGRLQRKGLLNRVPRIIQTSQKTSKGDWRLTEDGNLLGGMLLREWAEKKRY